MAAVPVWVLDTNVLVSGLLSPSGPPGRLVDVLLGRRLKLAFDDRIEAEYREVLARPTTSPSSTRASGTTPRPFEWLTKAYEERSGFLFYIKCDRRFDRIRPDPRFESLIRKIGLPLDAI